MIFFMEYNSTDLDHECTVAAAVIQITRKGWSVDASAAR
jgi:hypothetical protein